METATEIVLIVFLAALFGLASAFDRKMGREPSRTLLSVVAWMLDLFL